MVPSRITDKKEKQKGGTDMDEKYIYGIRLRVKDAGEAVKWLCGNLFFQIEKDGEVPVVKNGNVPMVI